MAYPCGKCPTCVSSRRRQWTNRILLEAQQWSNNSFATLTYAPEVVPVSLEPEHLTLFLKRLRGRWKEPVRYYAVGEYSPTLRPHFHLALFNFPACQMVFRRVGDCPCRPCSVVREAWSFGHILLGSLEPRSAQYIAGYVVKKINSRKEGLLQGRRPEFARMSLRPGIGADATWDVASVLLTYPRIVQRQGDVPTSLRHGTRILPLGPYLRRLVRERIGRDRKAPEVAIAAARARVSMVFDYAFANAPAGFRNATVKGLIGDWNEQLNRNVAAQNRVRGSLL